MESKAINQWLWVLGRYTCEAIATCFGKHHKYPKEPFGMKERVSDSDGEESEAFTDADRFGAFAAVYNAHKGFS